MRVTRCHAGHTVVFEALLGRSAGESEVEVGLQAVEGDEVERLVVRPVGDGYSNDKFMSAL